MTQAQQLMEECKASSLALMEWFKSQDISTTQALGTMAMVIAAIAAESSNPIKALHRWELTSRLVENMIADHLLNSLLKGDGQ